MKKDIIRYNVEGVYVAIARKPGESGDFSWYVYLINDNQFALSNVLITSKGYGDLGGEKKKTSVLRQMFEKIDSRSYEVVEPIKPELFALCNEFWVSYYLGSEIYDKKYIFLPESLTDNYISHIDQLGLEGILHY